MTKQEAVNGVLKDIKTGHWIMTSDYLTTAYGSIDYVKCSCCGKDSLEEGDYCPNCGGKDGGRRMTKQEAIDVLKSECYVFNPLNFDRTALINTAIQGRK